jgi:hypothetical protein
MTLVPAFPFSHVRSSVLENSIHESHSLTIMEKVIEFMIDMYRSLLMCTIEFVVRGSLAVLIGAVNTVSGFGFLFVRFE